jgi:hypothetical protein
MQTRSVVATLFVLLVMPTNALLMGAHCNTRSTMESVRQVHSGVRQAFVEIDEELAPRLARAGNQCIAQAEEAGHGPDSGEEGMAFWRECMERWNQLQVAVATSREVFASLEQVYTDIEAGLARETDWQVWARQAIAHGRTILRIIGELREDLDQLDAFRTALENLCDFIGCEGD